MKQSAIIERLLEESKDKTYDLEDRRRFKSISKKVSFIPKSQFKKLILANNYDYYWGYCVGKGLKHILNENEYLVLQGVIDNILVGYYMKRFIGKKLGRWIIDKRVRKLRNGKIDWVNTIDAEGMKPGAAIEFTEDEKEWLEKEDKTIEWEEITVAEVERI